MLLAEKELYKELDEKGVIDRRFPLWWTNGFEGRKYVKPDEFFGSLSDYAGRKFFLGPDDQDIKYTIINRKINGIDVPLFITAKPLDKNMEFFVEKYGIDDFHPFIGECYPHARGIALANESHALYWYPTKSQLDDKIDFEGMWIGNHLHFSDPFSFFGKIITYQMSHCRRTYYSLDESRGDCKISMDIVPFYEFPSGIGKATIVPTVNNNRTIDFPTLIIHGEEGPIIRGFTDSHKAYRVHRKIAERVKKAAKERFGWDCNIYK